MTTTQRFLKARGSRVYKGATVPALHYRVTDVELRAAFGLGGETSLMVFYERLAGEKEDPLDTDFLVLSGGQIFAALLTLTEWGLERGALRLLRRHVDEDTVEKGVS